MKRVISGLVTLVVTLECVAFAQGNFPYAQLQNRVFLIKAGNNSGTAFTVEEQNKQFLITARHVVDGLPAKGASIGVFQMGSWQNVTVDIYLPDEPQIDVAVIATQHPLSPTDVNFNPEDTWQLQLGQDMYFLGFPVIEGEPLYNRVDPKHPSPIVKHGFFSGADTGTQGVTLLYIDGFNNFGFSGGPVVYYDFRSNAWRFAGVIHGFAPEPTNIKVGNRYVQTNVLANSGILLAFQFKHVLQLIRDKALPAQEQHR